VAKFGIEIEAADVFTDDFTFRIVAHKREKRTSNQKLV
jgi:hypothetical protein